MASRATLADNRIYVSIYEGVSGSESSDAVPNCFFDKELRHPFMFSNRYAGALVEYDSRSGDYLRHDTVPAYWGHWGGGPAIHPDYIVNGVNLVNGQMVGTYYYIRQNRHTGDMFYGNPHTFNGWTSNSYLFAASRYGHICRTGDHMLYVFYDTLLDMRRTRYDIIAQPVDSARGTVEGSGTYRLGDTAILTATPFEGYHFSHWHDGNTDNPRTLVVAQSETYLAHFTSDDGIPSLSPNSYSLNIYPNPTTGEVRVECGALGVEQIELLDLQGRVVRSFQKPEVRNQNAETWTLDLSSLPKGSYLVRCGNAMKKLILQ